MTTSIVIRAALAAFIPAIAWLTFIVTRERLEPRAKRLIVTLLFGSIGAVVVAAIAEVLIFHRVVIAGGSIVLIALTVGLIEEATKLGATALLTRKSPLLKEPLDGVIFSATTALGFAAFETTYYILTTYKRVVSAGASTGFAAHLALTRVAPVRAVTGSLAHVAWAGIVGYAYGLVRTRGADEASILWAYLLAAALHAAFDGLIFAHREGVALLLLAASGVFFIARLTQAWRSSPTRTRQLLGRPATGSAPGTETAPMPIRPDTWLATHRAPADGLFAWSAPAISSTLVCALSAGTEIHETDRRGDWAHVSTRDGRAGWVVARLLIPASKAPPSASVP